MPKRSRKSGKGGRKGKSKKQKLYNMRGCSKTKSIMMAKAAMMAKTRSMRKSRGLAGGSSCGTTPCPIAPFSWKQMQQSGGTCGTCGAIPMSGGSFYKPASPIPGPFVGQSWSPSIANWPGVNGIGGDSNYLANNLYNNGDPQTMMKLGGSKRRRKKHRGGGIIPQDMVNLGRDVSFNFKSAYNALNGYTAPINSLPYKDQLSGSMSANKMIV